jgi:hypothetical protein
MPSIALERTLANVAVTRALVCEATRHLSRPPVDLLRATIVAVGFVAGAETLPHDPLDLDVRALAYAFLGDVLRIRLDYETAVLALDTANAYLIESCGDPETSLVVAVAQVRLILDDCSPGSAN